TSPIGEYLLHLWKSWDTFMPSPFSMEGIQWLYDKYIKMFEYPASLGIFALAAGLFFVGCITLLAHRKGALFLLTVPFVVVLATSYFEKYPFADRMILFLVPVMYLIIAEAVIQIQVKLLSYKILICDGCRSNHFICRRCQLPDLLSSTSSRNQARF
ncbi:hypothetical protein QUF54_11150, partial [Candidatus Marithioploca araucensis]|nr:hypothetical protein [Candidatus Marithioploca araucensis]